jgi:hypothetical protein
MAGLMPASRDFAEEVMMASRVTKVPEPAPVK